MGLAGCTFDYGLWGVGGVDLTCTTVADCPKGFGEAYCSKLTGCAIASANSGGYCVLAPRKAEWEAQTAA